MFYSNVSAFKSDPKQSVKTRPSCPLCKQAGRPSQHFLSKCKYLPQTNKAYLSRSRLTTEFCDVQDCDSDTDDNPLSPENFSPENQPDTHNFRVVSTSRRVSTMQSPQMKVFYKQFPLQIILDSGAEISMIKTSVANYIGAPIQKSEQKALQADGVTPLSIAGETHLMLSRNGVNLKLEALVVNDLDIDILAGIPFLTINDIGLRPSKQEAIIGGSDVVCYGPPPCDPSVRRVRRTQAVVLRSPATSVIWAGEYLEVDLPDDFSPDCTVSIEARPDSMKVPQNWPLPTILEAVCRKARIVNDSNEPKIIKKT